MVKRLNRYNGKVPLPSDATMRLRSRAFTRIELLVIVVVLLALLALLFLPVLSATKTYARQAACHSTLKSLGIGFRVWAGDHNDFYPMRYFTNNDGTMEFEYTVNAYRHFQVMSNELSNPRILVCPADDRKPAPDFASLNNNNLSYFVDLGADESNPTLWLAGDRNLVTNGVNVVPGLVAIGTNTAVGWSVKMHNSVGYVALADGSVSLQRNITNTGTNVTRLAVP